jgi:hypothetical protein
MKTFPSTAVAGTVVWIGVIAGSISGLAHLTLIDVLFLLAPLVIVPLGLRLIHFDDGIPSRLLDLAILIQPAAALLAVIAFLLASGTAAGVVAGFWLLTCVIAALGALAHLVVGRSLHPVRLVPAAAVGFMAFGALWLVLSRAGIRPLGLDRQIVELTAVHFHFTAFAATLLAALILIRLRDERGVWHNVALTSAILLMLGSPVLAAGWGTPIHVLQVLGAILIATGVIGTATIMLFRSNSLTARGSARGLLRLAAVMPLLPMVLAVEYSTGRTFGFRTLDIQTMALVHGNFNALGFVFLGLVAWTVSEPGYRRLGAVSRNAGMTSLANSSS